MKYLSIKDFEDLQHYKDWQPPWIKLYNRLLDDWNFLQLSELAQRHLICLWLLASRHDNRIPNDLVYITRAIQAKSVVDLEEMIVAGFVIPTDAEPRHKRRKRNKLGRYNKSRQSLERVYKKSSPETETETETDKRQKKLPTGPKYPHFATADSKRLQQVCVTNGFVVEVPVLRKALAELFPSDGPVHPMPELENALIAFIEARGGVSPKEARFWTIFEFAKDVGRWVRIGKMPLVDLNGVTERGRLATGG